METIRRHTALLWLALLGALGSAMLLLRLSAYGIWDPWELGTADAARHLLEGKPDAGHLSFSTWLVSRAFGMFGVHEWTGRLPIALCGLITAAIAFSLVARHSLPRTGFYAALITLTTPLFLLNSRAMLGEAPSFMLQTAIGYCAMAAAFPSRSSRSDAAAGNAAWLLPLSGLVYAALVTRGALLCAAPPLLSVTLVAWLLRDGQPSSSRAVPALLTAGSCVLAAFIARDVMGDGAGYSMWIGGRSLSVAPPTFDAVLEEVFHAFAPWSALLPIAVASLWHRSAGTAWLETPEYPEQRNETPLLMVAVIWAALGYAAQTLYMSRYGSDVTYLPVVAMSALVAMFLSQVERRGGSHWGIAISVLFLTGLLLRDFLLYPSGPVAGLPIAGFELPKAFNPKGPWAGLLSAFGACALLCFGASSEATLALGSPYRFVREQWRHGLTFKLWLIATALVLIGALVLGGLALAIPQRLGMPTVATKWVARLVFVPPGVVLLIGGFQLAVFLFGKLGKQRFVPMLLAGAAIGGYSAQVYLPAFSEHLSPREVYDTYNQLAKPGEVLGEYHVSGRAASYYAKGKVTELTSQTALVDHLATKQRRWVAFPADELAALDRAYRKRTGEHIVVADSRSARVLLGTNLALAGKTKESFLNAHVRKAPPAKIQNPVSVNFDNRIELLGYDLALPHGDYVGAGESFKITWYYRCKAPVPGSYKVFIHIDGEGQRIHGDHDPVDGNYPVRMWDEGDVIYDEHELDVPGTYASGEYDIFLGFYSGDTRLPVVGPSEDNRVRVGVLRIR